MTRSLISLLALVPTAIVNAADDPREVALAAFNSGPMPTPETVAGWIATLKSAGTGDGADAVGLRTALLDALIRAEAAVPGDILEPLFRHHPEEVVVLLSRDPPTNRECLLRLMDRTPPSLLWMAIGDVLLEADLPGAAARVMGALTFRCEVTVIKSKPSESAAGFGGARAGGRSPELRVRGKRTASPGWPPVVRYTLTDVPRFGDRFLGGRAHLTYWRRESFDGTVADLVEYTPSISTTLYCLDCAGYGLPMVTVSGERYASRGGEVQWKGPEQFLRDIEKFRRECRDAFDTLAKRMVKHKLMTREEREALKCRIVWEVENKAGVTLPDIPEE